MKNILITSVLIIILSLAVLAGSDPLDFIGPRQAAMGGAYVAVADDLHALHTNPAGLVQRDGVHFNLLTIQQDLGVELADEFSNLQDIAALDDENEQIAELSKLIPMDLGYNLLGILPTYTGNTPPFLNLLGSHMGVGGFVKGYFYGDLVRPTSPEVQADARVDGAMILGFAKNWPPGFFPVELAVGYSLKYIIRSKTSEFTQSAVDILNGEELTETSYQNVTGWALDIGTLFNTTLPYIGASKVGIVAKNIGNAALNGKAYDESGDEIDDSYTDEVPMVVVVGLCWTKDLDFKWPVVSLLNGATTFAVDYDLVKAEATFWKRLHGGLEKRVLGDLIALRAGLNQGYGTVGIGLDWLVFHLNYAYYVEELGDEIGVEPYEYHIVDLGISF
jgi:hypothetical protein